MQKELKKCTWKPVISTSYLIHFLQLNKTKQGRRFMDFGHWFPSVYSFMIKPSNSLHFVGIFCDDRRVVLVILRYCLRPNLPLYRTWKKSVDPPPTADASSLSLASENLKRWLEINLAGWITIFMINRRPASSGLAMTLQDFLRENGFNISQKFAYSN